MSIYDNLMSQVDKIGMNNPIADDDGNLVLPPPKAKATKGVFETTQKFESKYDTFFESVEGVAGKDTGAFISNDDAAKMKAKKVFLEAIEMMSKENLAYWTNDATIKDACAKLQPIMTKISNRL